MSLDLNSLRRAVDTLERTTSVANDAPFMTGLRPEQRDAVKAGVIQTFEFTYELCWKFMKRQLELDLGATAAEGVSRRELFRIAAQHRLIDDVAGWFNFHKARNLTSHTYAAEVAEEVLRSALLFAPSARGLLGELERRNA